MFFGTPKRSITSSAFGSAASELAVVNAIRNGSRIAFTNVEERHAGSGTTRRRRR